jgi:hypothetical protein
MARAFRGAVVAALLAWPGRADAQADKRACLVTYVEAQSKRQEGKLIAARAAAVTCGGGSCPSVLRSDCVTWLREIDAAIPTVVFSASTPGGRDVTVATVTVDGRVAADRITGEEVAMDPGEHVVACEADGFTRVELRLVAAQGAKNRAVHFTIEPAGPPTLAPIAAGGTRPMRPIAVVLGALGVVGLGVWGVAGASALWGTPSVQTLDHCKPNCAPGDRQTVERKLNVADVAGAAALLALGGALVLHVTRPVVVVAAVQDGALGELVTRF